MLGFWPIVLDAGRIEVISYVQCVLVISMVLAAVGIPGAVGGYQVNFRLPANTLKGLASLQVSAGMIADTSVKVMVK